MSSAKVYAKTYLAITSQLDFNERILWMLIFRQHKTQRILCRIMQLPGSFEILTKNLKLPLPIAQFLTVLNKDKALAKLPMIINKIITLMHRDAIGTISTLTVAKTVNQEEQAQFFNTIEAFFAGKSNILLTQTDSRLLGGFTLEIGDQFLDQSLQNKLGQLQKILM